MKRAITLVGGVLAASSLAACATAEGGSASRCPGLAYDAVFQGGDYYDLEDRSRVSGILSREGAEDGSVSENGVQRVTNVVGADAGQQVVAAFNRCVDSQG